MADQNLKLPFEGEWHIPEKITRKETVVFTHFWGGRKEHLFRHIELVNDLGFKAVSFNFSYHQRWVVTKIPISLDGQFGLKHVWADEAEDVLNHIPGEKILFSFSNPTSAVIEALARRRVADVSALICDSGPLIYLDECNRNMLKYEYGVKSMALRLIGAVGISKIWSQNHEKELRSHLRSLPKGFPILSIRGSRDTLVPVYAIDDVFKGIDNIHLEILSIAKAGHLDGLKLFPEIYRPAVETFLNSRFPPLTV